MQLLPALQTPGVTAAALTIYGSSLDDSQRANLPFDVLEGRRANRSDYFFLHRVVKEIRQYAPDIVHAHTHVGKYWGVVAATLAHVPAIIFTEHNPCDPRRAALESLVNLPVHQIIRRAVTFFPEQRAFLARRDRIPIQKIVTIPNGLPEPEENTSERSEGRKRLAVSDCEVAVLVVGRLEFQKNQQLALRALAALDRATRSRVKLFFAGSGSDNDALRSLALALDIGERVSFLGYRKDVSTLLQAADVLLMTSLFEGMPLALIEGMFAGVPIVSTPWIGAGEMLGEGRFGMIAAGWQPQHVAEALERAVTPRAKNVAVAHRSRYDVIERYSMERMAREHERLYASLSADASA
jgi:L-malate glycosyltransferase